MRRSKVGLGGTVAVLALACATSEPSAPAPRPQARIESGQEAFLHYCATCHGESGAGDGPSADALKDRPADLRRIAARRGGVFPRAEVQRMIDGRDPVVAHGPRDMPIWGENFSLDLNPGLASEGQVRGQIQLILDYLETIQVPE